MFLANDLDELLACDLQPAASIFDGLKVGDRVHFIETVGDTGPIASKVWKVEGSPS